MKTKESKKERKARFAKYESFQAQDLFEGLEEPEVIKTRIARPVQERKEVHVERVLKYASMPESRSLEITKNGKLRTEKEIDSILKKKIEKRKERKKEKFLKFSNDAKERSQKLRKERASKQAEKDLALPESSAPQGVVLKEPVQQVVEASAKTGSVGFGKSKSSRPKAKRYPSKYTKQQREDFRKMNARKKAEKKERKKIRQGKLPAKNTLVSESAYFEIEPETSFLDHPMFKNIGPKHISAVLVIVQLYHSRNRVSDAAIIANYFVDGGLDPVNIAEGCLAFKAVRVLRSHLAYNESESLSEKLYDISSYAKQIMTSQAAEAFLTLLAILISARFFDKETAERLKRVVDYETVRKMKNCTYMDFFDISMRAVSGIVRAGELLANGMPLTSLLLQDDPMRVTIFAAKNWLRQCTSVHVGLPKEGSVLLSEQVAKGKELLDTLSVLKDKVNVLSSNGGELLDLHAKVRDEYNRLFARLKGQLRITPVGVMIHGSPGIGKSKIVDLVAKIHCRLMKREYHPGLVFHRVTSSQYWDGCGIDTPIYHYSELGNKRTTLVRSHGDPVIDELTSIIDSQPKALDMSAVEDKGKNYCTAELVIIDTNNEGMNLVEMVQNPAAYRRRFVYVEPVVKAQYAKKNSKAIDPEKCDDGTHFYSKWTFNVYLMEPINNISSRKKVLAKDVEYTEFCQVMYDHMHHHVESETRANEVSQSVSVDFLQEQLEEKHIEEQKMVSEAFYEDIIGTVFDQRATWLRRLGVFMHQTFKVTTDVLVSVVMLCVAVSYFMFSMLPWRVLYWDQLRAVLAFMIVFMFARGELAWSLFLGILLYSGETKLTLSKFVEKSARAALNRAVAGVRFKVNNFFAFFRIENRNVRFYASTGVAGMAGIFALYKLFQKFTEESRLSESSNFPTTDSVEELKHFEDVVGCAKSYERVKVESTNVWNTKQSLPSVHTSGYDSLYKRVMRNCRHAELVCLDNTMVKTMVLGVAGSYCLINKHAVRGALKSNKMFLLKVSNVPGQKCVMQPTTITKDMVIDVTDDVCIVKIEMISFVDIQKHFPADVAEFRAAKGIVMDQDIVVASHSASITIHDAYGDYIITTPVRYKVKGHTKGWCGAPVVAQRDRGACIVGLHSAGCTESTISYGVVILRDQIAKSLSELLSVVQRPLVCSESADFPHNQETHHKSPFRYEYLPYIEYYGSDGSIIMTNQKSRLTQSKFSEQLPGLFGELGLTLSEVYIPPVMQPRGKGENFKSPWNVGLKKLNTQRKSLHPKVLNKAISVLQKRLFEFFDEEKLDLKPLDLETAINGVAKDPFIRRVNLSAGAGYGTPGKKSKYIIRRTLEDGTVQDVPEDTVVEEILRIVHNYQEGISANVIYTANLKDEPRLIEKVAACKTRVFYASPLAYYLATRMFLGPFYSLMFEFNEIFCTAIGINMHLETEKLERMFAKRFTNILEGDYGGYDTSMPFAIGEAANTLVYSFLSRYGYNDPALAVVAGLLSDNLFFYICYLGEMIRVPGVQPSGKGYTAEDNSLRNLLCLMYFWYSSEELADKEFFDFCDPVSYGDDIVIGVSDEVKKTFNGITYSRFVDSALGMEFTTSSKGVVEQPFVDFEDYSFLKRKRRYSHLLKRIVSPLAVDSIHKALQWTMPSKVVSALEQDISTVNSCLRELVFHVDDMSKLEQTRNKLIETLAESHEVSADDIRDTFTPIASMVDDLCSQVTPVGEGRQDGPELDAESESLYGEAKSTDLADISVNKAFTHGGFGRPPCFNQWPAKVIYDLEQELIALEQEFEKQGNPCPGYTYRTIRKTMIYGSEESFKNSVDSYFRLKSRVNALRNTIDRMRSAYDSKSLIFEADVAEMKSGSVSASVKEDIENVLDISGDTTNTVTQSAVSIDVTDGGYYSMDNFVHRPVTISTLTMAEGADLTYSVNPWSAFFIEPSIRAKLRNFAYFRGDLVIKVTVSGTPFHYGRLQMSYKAMFPSNSAGAALSGLRSTNLDAALTYFSQSPIVREIDINNNEPVEMRVPFVCPAGAARLFNNTALILPAGVNFNDIDSLGELYLTSMVPARTTASVYTPVSIFIYAWLENVTFSGTTGTVIAVTSESDYDERKVGPIERFASNAAQVTGVLTNVPVLAPFAQASNIAATSLRDIAAIFGFSRPTTEENSMLVKNDCFVNGAHTICVDTGKKITLDPLQEVTIDGTDCAVTEDEMVIQNMAKRVSYLGKFEWASTDAPQSAPIFEMPVSPTFCNKSAVGVQTLIHRTALCAAVAPFRFWRGSLVYTFKAVCSRYHRGKLAIKFDPNIAQAVVIDSDIDLNKQSQLLWDLQETQSVKVCVNWAFPKAWCRTMDPKDSPNFGVVSLLGPTLSEVSNGYVSITPVTRLQSPDDSSIQILCYVHSEDMMVNCHNAAFYPKEYLASESDYGEDISCIHLNPENSNVSGISKVHFGELPVSFRSLGKRFGTQTQGAITDAGVNPHLECRTETYPAPQPPIGGGAITGGFEHVYNYLRPMYLGMRGGMKFRYMFEGVNFKEGSVIRIVNRNPEGAEPPFFAFSSFPDRSAARISGTITYVPHTNAGIEAEIPVYTSNKFAISFSDDPFPTDNSTVEPIATRNHSIYTLCDGVAGARYMQDIAFGDDFSFFRFEGAPPYVVT